MSLHNPSALYTGGLVKLDSTPYVNNLLRYRAQRAAKEEALDKYFGELPKTLNSAGLRDEDIEGVNKRVDGLKQYYLQNKDAIRKGGAARYNYEKAIRETSGYIDSGKNKAKNLLELGKKRFEKGNEYIFADPQMTEKIHKWSLPLDHPEYEPFDPATTTLPVRPFNDEAHTKKLGLVKADEYEVKTEIDPADPLKDIVTQVPKFSPQKLEQLRFLALDDFHKDPSFENKIHDVMQDASIKPILEEVYKKYYGSMPTEPEEFATAYGLAKLMPAPEKVTRVANTARVTANRQGFQDAQQNKRFRHQEYMARLQDGYAKGRINYRAAKTGEEQENILNSFVNNQYENAQTGVSHIMKIDGKVYRGRMVDVPKAIADKYVVDKGFKTETRPVSFLLTEDKQSIVPIYSSGSKTAKGDVPIDKNNTKPISIQNYKAELSKLLLSQKDRGDQVIEEFTDNGDVKVEGVIQAQDKPTKVAKPLPKGQPRTVKQNGFTYTWNPASGQYE